MAHLWRWSSGAFCTVPIWSLNNCCRNSNLFQSLDFVPGSTRCSCFFSSHWPGFRSTRPVCDRLDATWSAYGRPIRQPSMWASCPISCCSPFFRYGWTGRNSAIKIYPSLGDGLPPRNPGVWQLPSFYCSSLPAPEVISRVLSTSFFRLTIHSLCNQSPEGAYMKVTSFHRMLHETPGLNLGQSSSFLIRAR